MLITTYLHNTTGVTILAIIKTADKEAHYVIDPMKVVPAYGGTPGYKCLLSFYRHSETSQWEPFEAQVIEAHDGHKYNLAPTGIPVEPDKFEHGIPIEPKDKDEVDAQQRY